MSDPEHPVHLTTMDRRVGHLNTIAYSPTRDLIAAAGDGRTVVQFLYDTESAAGFVCRNVWFDPISRSEWTAHAPVSPTAHHADGGQTAQVIGRLRG